MDYVNYISMPINPWVDINPDTCWVTGEELSPVRQGSYAWNRAYATAEKLMLQERPVHRHEYGTFGFEERYILSDHSVEVNRREVVFLFRWSLVRIPLLESNFLHWATNDLP